MAKVSHDTVSKVKYIEERKFKDKNEVILWMIDNQLGRRNLPDYARVELNLRKEELKLITY